MEERSFQLKDYVKVNDASGYGFARGVVVGRTIQGEPRFDVATDEEILLNLKQEQLTIL